MNNNTKKKNPWLWIIFGLLGFWVLSTLCESSPDLSGPQFPFDDQYAEDRAIQQEILEGRAENQRIANDPCLQDIIDGVPPEYQRCDGNDSQSNNMYDKDSKTIEVLGSSCKCSQNIYNCNDFSTQRSAHSCYENCLSKVGYDIHWLDDDDDGIACELNP